MLQTARVAIVQWVVRDGLVAEQLQRERDELRGALARFGGGSGALLGLATAPLSTE